MTFSLEVTTRWSYKRVPLEIRKTVVRGTRSITSRRLAPVCYSQPQLRSKLPHDRPVNEEHFDRQRHNNRTHFFISFPLPPLPSPFDIHRYRFNRPVWLSLLSAVYFCFTPQHITRLTGFFTLCVCSRVLPARAPARQMGTKSRQRKVIFWIFMLFPMHKIACAINSFPSTCMSACWHDRFFFSLSEWHLILDDPTVRLIVRSATPRRRHIRIVYVEVGGNKILRDVIGL